MNLLQLTQSKMDKIRDEFAEEGLIHVPEVLNSEELTSYRNEVDKLVASYQDLPEKLVWHSPAFESENIRVVQRISRANQFSPVIAAIPTTNLFIHKIAELTVNSRYIKDADGFEGSDGAVIVIKDPRNASEHSSLRWHQDATFTQHLPINPFVNLGIYLDNSDESLGGLVVVPKTHRFPNSFDIQLKETTLIATGEKCISAKAGDVVVHSSMLWHCSRQNKTQGSTRRILYFNFYPVTSL